MRFGAVILPEHRWSMARRTWERAEQLGLDHVWVYDHLAWRSLRDGPWFAAVPTLAAAALVTERIRLGTLVASPNFRHPVPFAKELVALDDLSEGRLSLGFGAGSETWDATMLGQEPWSRAERSDRFIEFVEGLDQLLRAPATSFAGTYYAADEARMLPGCVQQPRIPFVLAANGPQGMDLTVRHGQAWVTTGDRSRTGPMAAPEGAVSVREQMDRLDEVCQAAGRDPATLDRMVLTGPILDPGLGSVEQFRDTAGRYAEIGMTDFVVHWPRPSDPFAADIQVFEAAVAT